MVTSMPGNVPKPHLDFIVHSVKKLAREPWLIGIAGAGSLATGTMDRYSDLDLVLAIDVEEHAAVMGNRIRIAESLGSALSVFTGDHIGQPQLVICLYDAPLLHVDMIFDTVAEIMRRADDLIVLWERDDRLSIALSQRSAAVPELDPQFFEDRIWVWIHKAAGKIGRGELLEAIEYLGFLRNRVLGPLALNAAGRPPIGLRRIELIAPSVARDLTATLATDDPRECLAALRACVEVYRKLRRTDRPEFQPRREAEAAVMGYLDEIERSLAS